MKRVVHLITLLELGGAQGNTIHTVEHLDRSEYEAHLWCGQGAFWDEEIKRRLGASGRIRFFPSLVRNVSPLKDFLAVVELRKALKKFQPDILHTHSSKAGILGRLAGHLAGVPKIVHTFHGFGFNNEQKPWTRWLYVFLERTAARWADALVFVSEANQDEANALGIGTPRQYRRIRSGVPIGAIRRTGENTDAGALKKSLDIPAQNKIVITVSAFKPQKNLIDFLEMAGQVKKKVRDVSFLIVGDGEQRGLLENHVRSRGLNDSVKLVGWRKDAATLLAASDVFVLTSLWEGLPRAMVEAMILGKPAVCYETDGVADVLRKGGGMLVSQKNVGALVDHVVRLLSDPVLWREVSEQAKTLITKEFDIDEMVRAQERLYAELNQI